MDNTLLGIMLFAALIATTLTFVFKHGVTGFLGAGIWLLTGLISYSLSSGGWDVYRGLFLMSAAMVIAMAFLPLVLNSKKEDDKDDISLSDIDRFEKDWDELNRGTRVPRLRRSQRRPTEGK